MHHYFRDADGSRNSCGSEEPTLGSTAINRWRGLKGLDDLHDERGTKQMITSFVFHGLEIDHPNMIIIKYPKTTA